MFGINKEEIDKISDFINPPKPPLTLKKIGSMLKLDTNSLSKKYQIKNFITNVLNYSYKKGSSTTIKGASRKIRIMQEIFSWRILKEILLNKFIINIDESSF